MRKSLIGSVEQYLMAMSSVCSGNPLMTASFWFAAADQAGGCNYLCSERNFDRGNRLWLGFCRNYWRWCRLPFR